MANETLEWLVLVIALFGMLIVLFERSSAVKDFGVWAGKLIRTKKQAMLGTFVLGVIVFLDDYLNNLAVGTTMKVITDKHKIPRTQLAYVVNSVAAPVCILIPISSWAVYFAGLLEEQGITVNGSGMGAYVSALPLMFYGWLAVIVVVLQITGIIPKLGLIKRDTQRALASGDVFPEGYITALGKSAEEKQTAESTESQNANPVFFLLPLAVMIAVTILAGIDVMMGALGGVATAFLLYAVCRKMNIKDLLTACYDGIVSMSFVMVLSVLAFSVQSANLDLKLADFVISVTEPVMSGAFLPAVVFLVCAVYAYATGCFWDLAVIITPIVIPLAQAMEVNPILAAAAVFSGAAFGSNTCLYGDGVIMCSQACGIKSIDLMFATLPYALIAGGGSVILYLIAGFAM